MNFFKWLTTAGACFVLATALAQTPDTSIELANDHAFQTTGSEVLLPPNYYRPRTPFTPIPVRLQFEPAIGATRYNVQVATDAEFSSIVFRSNVPRSPAYFDDAEPGTTYYWRAQSVNETGTSNFGPVWTFSTIIVTLDAPTLLEPANGARDVPMSVMLRWMAVDGATVYITIVSEDPTLSSSSPRQILGGPGTQVKFTARTPGTYYWRVGAEGVAPNLSPGSPIWSFTTVGATALHTPVLLTPWNMQSNVPVSVELRFEPVDGARRYNVQVASDPGFNDITFRTNVPKPPVRFNGAAGGHYYWRVQAVRYADTTPFSPAWSFNMASSSQVAETASLSSFDADLPESYALYDNYPNPFNPSTTITVDVPESGNIRVVIYDLLGHEVAELVSGTVEAGTYSYSFDASNLSSGMYLYRIESAAFTQTKRMMLLK